MSENVQPQGELTLEDLEKFLETPTEDKNLEGYLCAAAVLAAFDLLELCPVDTGVPAPLRAQLIDGLLPLCEPVTQGPDRGLWSLLLPPRRSALRGLLTKEKMIAALAANPKRPTTLLQQVWERVLQPSPILMERLSRGELAALSTVVDWVEGILEGLPDQPAIRKAILQSDLLAPMRRLAERGFVGREDELARLAQFVFGEKPPAPLYVFGSGGVGKSTLLSRFILMHAVPKNVPIAYVDLDRPTVRPNVPLTLLLDALSQFGSQIDVSTREVDAVLDKITGQIARAEIGRQLESATGSWVVGMFSQNINGWLQGRTAVLIVDTMEEAQFLGADVMQPLVDFLLDLDRMCPGLRLILSGRALPPEYVAAAFPMVSSTLSLLADDPERLSLIPLPSRPVNLSVLQPDPARQLLQESLRESGLPALEENEVDEVIALVSRNPMCLKLAARLLRDEGVDKLRTARSEVFSRLKAEKVQALLYGRILGHIHSDDVRKIAYSGLIVRRIDADVIREVLAEPCGLQLNEQRNEYTLLNDLASEAALVEVDPTDNSLRHRADVRRAMLEDLLEQIEQPTVDAIDKAAIEFYEKRPGPTARAEEIYHRLRRCDPESILDERWSPDAAGLLRGAIDELPARQRLWLAERLGVTLDKSIRQEADQHTWERQAARSADRYLGQRSPQQALAVLQERTTRSPRSPLYSLEAEAYRFLGQFDEALRVARAGVESAATVGAIDMALDLLLKMVVIEEVRGRLEAAETLIQEATGVASHSANKILQLRVKITWLRLQRQLRPAARRERAALRREAMAQLTDQMLHQLRGYPVLLREVAAELAKQDPRIASAAIETLGVEVATDAQAQALGHAIATLGKIPLSDPNSDPTLAEGAVHFENADFDPKVIRKWVTETMTGKDTTKLGGTILAATAGARTLSGFRKYFRAGVESTLRGGSDVLDI